MGQYYTAVNIDKRERIYSHSFGSGLKLTESSYVGNDYMEAFSWLLAGPWKGDKVFYCGDYAWSQEGGSAGKLLHALTDRDPYEFAKKCEDISTRFAACKGNTRLVRAPGQPEDAPCLRYVEKPIEGTFDIEPEHYRFLANFDRLVYVDREKSPVAWVWREGRKLGVTRYDPLPLYLVIGNGLGGGDFRGTGEGEIGSWAGQKVVPTNNPPAGFALINIPFDEEGLLVRQPDDEVKRIVRKHKKWARGEYCMETPELNALLKRAVA